MNWVFFMVMTLIWAAFATALVASPASLDGAWQRFQELPRPVEAVVWLLVLPWMIGLAIWESSWKSRNVRLLVVTLLGLGCVVAAFNIALNPTG
jgi:hypothetical protein